MQIRNWLIPALCSLIWLPLLPACSKSDEDRDNESVEFPIPYPEGEEIITDEWNGETGHITLRYHAGRYDEAVGFYDDYASGGDWNRTEAGQGEQPSVIYVNLNAGLTIDIGPPDDQMSGAILITLYVAE